MKLGNEQAVSLLTGLIPIDASLEAVFNRLDAVAMEPGFRLQREIALRRALRPYLLAGEGFPVAPLPEEVALAKLYLYADFQPEDGQLSLVEQVRDLIEVHVPEEERAWLDPLRHSYMDLLEIVAVRGYPLQTGGQRVNDGELVLRSLGDGREFHAAGGPFTGQVTCGQVLLTRLIRLPDRAVLPGTAVVLSAAVGRAILEHAQEQRREMEASSGSFELGDWDEFCKLYGYGLLWILVQARVEAVMRADANIRYLTPAGEPFLYALALYEHHELSRLMEGLNRIEGLQPEPLTPSLSRGPVARGARCSSGCNGPTATGDGRGEGEGDYQGKAESARVWVQRDGPSDAVVARLTLSRAQLFVECDSPDRLDRLKHLLASTFGYSLHFRAGAAAPPAHPVPEVDLSQDGWPSLTVVVTPEEEQRLLSVLLESAYLEWADLPSPGLQGRTPRHAAGDPEARAEVAGLIDQLEHDDPCRRRTGRPGYDFDRLRAHVGL